MNMRSIIAVSVALSAGLAYCDDWKDGAVDLGTYTGSPGNLSFINGPYAVTLSQDNTLNANLRVVTDSRKADVTFDFASGGNHALTVTGSFYSYNAGTSYPINYVAKGGVWDIQTDAALAGWKNSCRDAVTAIWDGATVSVKNQTTLSYNARNSVVVLTNGTVFTAKQYNGVFNPDSGYGTSSNCTVWVTAGSQYIAEGVGSELFSTDWRSCSPATDRDYGYRFIVSGQNSLVESKLGGVVGYKTPGIEMRVEDGAEAKFNGYLSIGYSSTAKDNRLIVDSNAKLSAANDIRIGAAAGADRSRLHVQNGGTLELQAKHVNVGYASSFNELVVSNATLTGVRVSVGNGAGTSNNVARIVGSDTQFDVGNYPTFFGAGHDNAFIVDGGMSLGGTDENKDFSFNATESTPIVGDTFAILGGSTVTCDEFYIGHHGTQSAANDRNNRLIVVGGSSLVLGNATCVLRLRAPGDTCVISNASLTAYDVCAGYSGATNTAFRFVGPQTVFTGSRGEMAALFGSGRNNLFEIDGATIGSASKAVRISNVATSNNTLRIVNGGTLLSGGFHVGYVYNGGRCDVSNTVFVGENSVLSGSQIAFTGLDNRLVVSNGTVTGSTQWPLSLGHVDDADTVTCLNSGNTLVLQGSSPRVTGTNPNGAEFVGKNHSVIRFELSGDGYENVPFECSMNGDGTTEIEVSVDPKMMETLERSRTYQLTAKACSVPTGTTRAEYIAKINAGLPTGCRAYFDASNRLFVRVRALNGPGMTIILR